MKRVMLILMLVVSMSGCLALTGCEETDPISDPWLTRSKLDEILRNQASADAMYASLNATYKDTVKLLDLSRANTEDIRKHYLETIRENVVLSVENQGLLDRLTPDPNEPPQYGKGELPPDYKAMFGTDNGARLDFVQNQMISGIVARIEKLEKPVTKVPDDIIIGTAAADIPPDFMDGVEVVE